MAAPSFPGKRRILRAKGRTKSASSTFKLDVNYEPFTSGSTSAVATRCNVKNETAVENGTKQENKPTLEINSENHNKPTMDISSEQKNKPPLEIRSEQDSKLAVSTARPQQEYKPTVETERKQENKVVPTSNSGDEREDGVTSPEKCGFCGLRVCAGHDWALSSNQNHDR